MLRKSITKAATAIRERVIRPLLPKPVVAPLNRNDRTGALCRAWGYAYSNQLRGGYYEFGVYRGASFRASWTARADFALWQRGELTSSEAWRRRVAASYADYSHPFYAFDTFEGMPDNAEKSPVFIPGSFAGSLEAFRASNAAAGITESASVRYFKGTFAETLAAHGSALAALAPAAIVNVDCDLYESARDALAVIAPKLQQGTVLLMDDWNHFQASDGAGSRRALREFEAAHPGLRAEPWFAYEFIGQAFLIHKNGR